MTGNEYIGVTWVDNVTEEIIFVDAMTVTNFKKIHGVSPHSCPECGYHDVIIKIARP